MRIFVFTWTSLFLATACGGTTSGAGDGAAPDAKDGGGSDARHAVDGPADGPADVSRETGNDVTPDVPVDSLVDAGPPQCGSMTCGAGDYCFVAAYQVPDCFFPEASAETGPDSTPPLDASLDSIPASDAPYCEAGASTCMPGCLDSHGCCHDTSYTYSCMPLPPSCGGVLTCTCDTGACMYQYGSCSVTGLVLTCLTYGA